MKFKKIYIDGLVRAPLFDRMCNTMHIVASRIDAYFAIAVYTWLTTLHETVRDALDDEI